MAPTNAQPLTPAPAAARFTGRVFAALSLRTLLLTQTLGLLFAFIPWLEHLNRQPPDNLALNLAQQALTAGFMLLAALAGDAAVRGGWSVGRAFITGLLCACAATALALWGLVAVFERLAAPGDWGGPERLFGAFLGASGIWGVALLVYLNRQSARRVLAGVRAGELRRLRSERRLIASRLSAAATQVDPALVRQRLVGVRDLYAAADPAAEAALAQLIDDLRRSVARDAAAGHAPPPAMAGEGGA